MKRKDAARCSVGGKWAVLPGLRKGTVLKTGCGGGGAV